MQFHDLGDQGVELRLAASEHRIRIVFTDDRLVGGDFHDAHVVDGTEFFFFGFRRPRHPAQLRIETEEVLIGDGRQGRRFLFDGYVFLRFDRLMQPVGIRTPLHQTSRELVDDDDFFFLDDIFHILHHDVIGFERHIEMVDEVGVG